MVEKEEKEPEKEEAYLRVCRKFKDLVEDFQHRFEEKHNIFPSSLEATSIIANKIVNIGGLKV